MAYLVLARKYRPATFADVVGQGVITQVLRGAVSEGRLGHAYLFCGPRGTGKTTTARILAKGLNCEKGPTADPCGECERCLAAEAGHEVDLIEIDAASHTSVEGVRDLRDQAAYAPMRARHKVYIIDEVHMLSKGAFNALLKTLEEPPAHVVFLFATTEPERVPDTVLSRCQVLKLSPIKEHEIAARLDRVFELEEVQAESGVTLELARRARGGMRDALSLADQLLALVGDQPKLEDVERLGGEFVGREIETLLDALEACDPAAALAALPAEPGGEPALLDGLLASLRRHLVIGLCGQQSPLVDASPEERQQLRARAERLGRGRLQLWLDEALYARERMRRSSGHERLVIELCLCELAREASGVELSELCRRLEQLEQAITAGGDIAFAPRAAAEIIPAVASTPAQAASPQPASPQPALPKPAPPQPTSAPEPPAEAARSAPARPQRGSGGGRAPRSHAEAWDGLIGRIGASAAPLAELYRRAGRLEDWDGGRAVIHFDGLRPGERKIVAAERNQELARSAFSSVAGQAVEVRLDVGGPESARSSGGARDQDSFTREVADLFGGSIEERG